MVIASLNFSRRVDLREQHELVDQPAHGRHVFLEARGVVIVKPVEFERQEGERRAQLVRDVGGERFLPPRGLIEPRQQIVDRIDEG